MLTLPQVDYLIRDVVFHNATPELNYDIHINDEEIVLLLNSITYTEPTFDFGEIILSEVELEFLNDIMRRVDTCNQNFTSLSGLFLNYVPTFTSFLKVVHFFANEQYLDKAVPADLHGRVTSKAVLPLYKKYLQIPILDIVIQVFSNHFNHPRSTKIDVVLSCDFDTLNLWKEIGLIGFIKREIKNVLYLRFDRLFKDIRSFFLADHVLKWNFYLNANMFRYPKKINLKNFKIRNIAFMLVKYENKDHDVDNDFDTRSFQEFHKSLVDHSVEIGIHPNYDTTSGNKDSFRSQTELFEKHFECKPLVSRFHYLRCKFPEDLRILSNQGITTDYTFSFADSLLFRGGRSCAVKLWDSTLGRVIEVQSQPLTIMDQILNIHLNYNYEEALAESKRKTLYALAFGSSLTLLWHNSYMYEHHFEGNYHPQLYANLIEYLVEIDQESSAH